MDAVMGSEEHPREPSPPIIIGCDIGQKVDPTTIVVVEAFPADRSGRRSECKFVARHLERLPIGTTYPDVAARIAQIVRSLESRPAPAHLSAPRLSLVIDATGVGRPVVDIVRDTLLESRCHVKPVTFTHGDQLNTSSREWRVGKAYLVSRLQVLLQTRRIKLPTDHPEAQAMAQELTNYELKVSEDGNDRYGAFRTGTHDDLVTALGLAVLRDPPRPLRVSDFARIQDIICTQAVIHSDW